jgi:hypothetical protein
MISFVKINFHFFLCLNFVPFFIYLFYSLVKWDFRFTWLLTFSLFLFSWSNELSLTFPYGIVPPWKQDVLFPWMKPHRGCRIVWIRVNFVWLFHIESCYSMHRLIVFQVWFAGGEFWEFDIQTGVPIQDLLFHCTSSPFCQHSFLIRLVYNCITDTM